MNTQDMTRYDRETLSALFDGELPADARQFAMRRLSHDAVWQAECGRWQLIGDAMRKQAPIAAPADLAARVRGEIEAALVTGASVPAALAAPASPRRRAPMWAGAALAASVAVAAVLVVRAPVGDAPGATPVVASARVEPAPLAGAGDVAPVAASEPAQLVAAATATPQAPGPVAALTDERGSVRPSASRSSRRSTAARSTGATDAPATIAAAGVDVPNPFHVPPSDPLAARPWPRASLASGEGAFTASYGVAGEAAGESPSFYPFEPRQQDTAASRNELP